MKVPSPPPLYLLWSYLPGNGSPAMVVRKFYAREVWRRRGAWERLGLLASFALWPVVAFQKIIRCTCRNGHAIKRQTGRGQIRQALDQLKLAAVHGMLPKYYYMYELYDEDKRKKASQYIHRYETTRELSDFLAKQYDKGAQIPMTDKAAFTAKCLEENLSVVPIFLVANGSGLHLAATAGPDDNGELMLPETDLFFKPIDTSIMSVDPTAPLSAARWDYLGGGHYKNPAGDVLTAQALIEHLKAYCGQQDYLVQPRLVNHSDIADLSNGALSSVTIQTCRNEQGGFEVINATFRMAIGNNTLADNVSLGGLASMVDISTGELGPATGSGNGAEVGWYDMHPDTAAQITGRKLPMWPQALDLAQRAHAAFPERIVVGWDMALTANGPMLLEGDPRGLVKMKQRTHGRPFGDTRYGELLAYHLQRALEARDRTEEDGS